MEDPFWYEQAFSWLFEQIFGFLIGVFVMGIVSFLLQRKRLEKLEDEINKLDKNAVSPPPSQFNLNCFDPPSNVVKCTSGEIEDIKSMSQEEYDSLEHKDSKTLYFIQEAKQDGNS